MKRLVKALFACTIALVDAIHLHATSANPKEDELHEEFQKTIEMLDRNIKRIL